MNGLEFRCIRCGEALIETEKTEVCELCGQAEETALVCPGGHYFCVACRLAEPAEVATRVCLATGSRDPFRIADTVMLHPHFLTHGPAFHFMVAPALIAAARNAAFPGAKDERISVASKRVECIRAAACGSFGGCGAALSVGAALSLLTRTNHLTGQKRAALLAATGQALNALSAFGGPRCYRQAVYSAIEVGVEILRNQLGIALPGAFPRCPVADSLADCHGPSCRYHG